MGSTYIADMIIVVGENDIEGGHVAAFVLQIVI